MKRRFRLTKSADFQRVRRYGRSYAHPLVVLVVLPNDTGDLRIGIAVGRIIGNAVRRNRIKRQLRAVLSTYLEVLQPGGDLLFIARSSIREASYQQIQSAIDGVLTRAKVLRHDIG